MISVVSRATRSARLSSPPGRPAARPDRERRMAESPADEPSRRADSRAQRPRIEIVELMKLHPHLGQCAVADERLVCCAVGYEGEGQHPQGLRGPLAEEEHDR